MLYLNSMSTHATRAAWRPVVKTEEEEDAGEYDQVGACSSGSPSCAMLDSI